MNNSLNNARALLVVVIGLLTLLLGATYTPSLFGERDIVAEITARMAIMTGLIVSAIGMVSFRDRPKA